MKRWSLRFPASKIEAVHMIPGWTHNIINLSETENLVTVMTCNEIFDPKHPDTFFGAGVRGEKQWLIIAMYHSKITAS